jgi:hypothetical protein
MQFRHSGAILIMTLFGMGNPGSPPVRAQTADDNAKSRDDRVDLHTLINPTGDVDEGRGFLRDALGGSPRLLSPMRSGGHLEGLGGLGSSLLAPGLGPCRFVPLCSKLGN